MEGVESAVPLAHVFKSQKIIYFRGPTLSILLEADSRPTTSGAITTAVTTDAPSKVNRVAPQFHQKIKEAKEERSDVGNPEIVNGGKQGVVAKVKVMRLSLFLSQKLQVLGSEAKQLKSEDSHIDEENRELVTETVGQEQGKQKVEKPIPEETPNEQAERFLFKVESEIIGGSDCVQK